jgi:hypothetical protein
LVPNMYCFHDVTLPPVFLLLSRSF